MKFTPTKNLPGTKLNQPYNSGYHDFLIRLYWTDKVNTLEKWEARTWEDASIIKNEAVKQGFTANIENRIGRIIG